MSSAIRAYVRRHHVGLLALFVALGGTTAWAVDGPNPGQNTVGSEDIIGNEVKSDDIGNGRIFNLDIADEVITGQKLKNGTVTGSDVDELSLQGVLGDSTLHFATGTADVGQRAFANAICDEGEVFLSGGGYGISTVSGLAINDAEDAPIAHPTPLTTPGDPV